MVASILPNGKNQFIDANGAPLVGGTVTFYIPETSTFKDTWQDPDQTIFNTNPIVLDDRGQAIIYGSGQYRQVLKDADGNLIWDQLTSDYSAGGSGTGIQYGTQTVIASASTTDIGSIATHNALVTGTATIDSFGTNADTSNPTYIVGFTDALTLTFNASSFILPGSADILTSNGDSSVWMYLGSGSWQCISYTPANVIVTSPTQFGVPVNVFMNNPVGSSPTVTFTSDFLVAATANFSAAYELANYSQVVNLATTGAGGMDTGTAPVSGFVSIYAIFNPATATASILACAQATSTGTLYSGSALPVGYTASTLLAIVPTDSLSQFQSPLTVLGRTVYRADVSIAIAAGAHSPNISTAVPTNAKTYFGYWTGGGSGPIGLTISGTNSTAGRVVLTAATSESIPLSNISVLQGLTPPLTYVAANSNAGTLHITGYSF